jgi:hypothetical protein
MFVKLLCSFLFTETNGNSRLVDGAGAVCFLPHGIAAEHPSDGSFCVDQTDQRWERPAERNGLSLRSS